MPVALGETKALPAGMAVYGLCLLALGVALHRETSPSRGRVLPLTPRQHGA